MCRLPAYEQLGCVLKKVVSLHLKNYRKMKVNVAPNRVFHMWNVLPLLYASHSTNPIQDCLGQRAALPSLLQLYPP